MRNKLIQEESGHVINFTTRINSPVNHKVLRNAYYGGKNPKMHKKKKIKQIVIVNINRVGM